MKTERLTSQRKIILDYLKSVSSHPTAETVYQRVKKKLPQISFGTVYRNLKLLKDKGEIQELTFGPSATRYDGNPEHHLHFHCNICGQVLDIFPERNKKCLSCLTKLTPGTIKDYRLEVYGICNDCLKLKSIKNEKGG